MSSSSETSSNLDHVNYDSLDRAKNAFIEASRRTTKFAERYGFIPNEQFGASANVFALDLKPFLERGAENLYLTLLPEGLGTSDDARPADLTPDELQRFWFNIGVKTVAVMTNDAASSGMQPILLSLYLPSSTPELVFDQHFMRGFLDGFVDGCKTVGCVYFSGETPQLKNKIFEGKLDIAGALFGLMPPSLAPIDGTELGAGDSIVFVGSSGPHDNGFTSLRELAERLPNGYRTELQDGRQYWEAINVPTVLYSPFIQAVLESGVRPTNVEPISGHGWQKIMRSAKPLSYQIERLLPVPAVFEFVRESSGSSVKDMLSIFNYGVGLVVYTRSAADAEKVVELAVQRQLDAVVAGKVHESHRREVRVAPLDIVISDDGFQLAQG